MLELDTTSERPLAPIANRTSGLTILVERTRLELFQPTAAMLTDTKSRIRGKRGSGRRVQVER